MRRSDSASHHPGQISFPGGGLEAVDKGDPAIAALREAAEETALDPAGVEVLGSFADAHVPVSANIVTPVLGWWRLPSEVAADHDESVEVFRVPVAKLLDADARGIVSIEFGDRVFESPAFELNERFGSHVVWGFTGLLLSSLFDQLGWAEPVGSRAQLRRAALIPLLLVAPTPLERQSPRVRGDELVHRVRAPRPRRVELHLWRVLEQRDRALPERFDAVGGGEERVVAAHRIEDQSLIGLENVL